MSTKSGAPLSRLMTFALFWTSGSAVLLACALVAAYQWVEFRKATVHDMTVIGDILAENTQAAIAFQDEGSAARTLQALKAEPQVAAACLYGIDGKEFSEYSPGGNAHFPDSPGADGHRFQGGRMALFRPVMLDGKRVGTIYLEATLYQFYARLRIFGGIVLLILAGSLAGVLVLARRLQEPISGPILALARTAKAVAESSDYHVRAESKGSLEVVQLTEAFNEMLGRIQDRDGALEAANRSLTEEVSERKRADGRVHDQLARMELLQKITRAISERQDIRSIFQVVVRTLEDRLPLDFCCICLLDEPGTHLAVTSVGARNEALGGELAAIPQGEIAIAESGLLAAVRGTLIYEPDIKEAKDWMPAALAGRGLRSLAVAPLLAESRIFGVVVGGRTTPASFSSGECEFLRQVSEHVALAAHQAQLHEALQQAYDDLRQTQQAVMQQERLRALGQMASGIAHDINNAISPAALYTESLLETENSISQKGRDYLTTIQRALDDVAQTVARMREFYRQKETEINLAPVPLNRLVREVIDLTRARWHDMPQQKGLMVSVETELADDLPGVLGIESEIREALVNLVFNAVDAMPEGGKLRLRTRPLARPGATAANSEWVAVEVIDSGIGMDEDTQRRCLEPFYTTKGERGTGLGLAMVYGTMRRHAGEIEIESVRNQGTTFRLLFQKPDASSLSAPDAPKVFKVASRLRVLVVDDDPLLIKSLRDILETDGHLVTTASGGQAGIDLFAQAWDSGLPFALVITDLGMPYVDGRRVASSIKAKSKTTPIIMLTGWGQRLVAEGDVPADVDRVLSKPPKLRALREAMAQCLSAEKT